MAAQMVCKIEVLPAPWFPILGLFARMLGAFGVGRYVPEAWVSCVLRSVVRHTQWRIGKGRWRTFSGDTWPS